MCRFPVYLDNIIFSLQRAGGISAYWFELIQRLAHSCDRLAMFESAAASKNLFRKKLAKKVDIRCETDFLPIAVIRYLPLLARIEAPAVFHSSYYRTSIQKDVANVVTVYDFTYERYRSGARKWSHFLQKKMALNRADGIICISESTKKDLLHFFPELAEKAIQVIHLAVSDEFRILNKTIGVDNNIRDIISKKYMVYVGWREDYKNFDVAVEVTRSISECGLLIIGGGALSIPEIKMLNEKLPDRFWHLQNVGNEILNIYYNHALCLLYPSSYEGFGMPFIEAMKAGCPVVALNTSSVPEVCGQAGILAEKAIADDFLEKIGLLEDSSFREKKIKEGIQNAGRFSWENCHLQTRSFYQKVFQKKYG